MNNIPSGTITFLFTDVCDSTRLWEKHPSEMGQALRRHDEVIESITQENNGFVVRPRGEGDSRFVVFERAIDGVRAAASIQQTFHKEDWPGEINLLVRMAVHTGEGEFRDGDYYGSAVNRCANLRSLAHGGQTLLSRTTYELIQDHLPSNIDLLDLGKHDLKGLIRTEHIYQIVMTGLPADFPPLSIDKTGFVLPLFHSSFVGRSQELAELETLINDPTTSLITILGGPGVGKTRLSIETARRLEYRFRDGVFFIPLAPLQSADAVLSEIARALGLLGIEVLDAHQRISNYLKSKEILLILDNFEHVLESARVVGEIVASSPKTKALVSSRERLNLTNESIHILKGLPVEVSHASEGLISREAIKLFLEHASRAAPNSAHLDDIPNIERICIMLEGNPLAIEMASAWINVMPPASIADDLTKSLDLLTSKMRDVELRHASMKAAFHYSFELLSSREQEVFKGFSVFRGSFDRSAANAILDAEIDILTSLIDKSLLTPIAGGRFELHEMLRQYASELLADSNDGGIDYSQKHAEYYGRLVENQTSNLMGGDQKIASDKIREEMSNISKMWIWSIENGFFKPIDKALDGLWIFFTQYANPSPGERLLWKAVDKLRSLDTYNKSALYLRCLIRYVSLLDILGSQDHAKRLLEEVFQLSTMHNKDCEIGLYHEYYASLSWPDRDEMIKHLKEAAQAFRNAEDTWSQARISRRLASVYSQQNNRSESAACHETALSLSRLINDQFGRAISLSGLAFDAIYRTGKLEQAKEMLTEGLRIREDFGEWASLGAIFALAWTEIALGNLDTAEYLCMRGLRSAKNSGDQYYVINFYISLGAVFATADRFELSKQYTQEAYELSKQIEDAFAGGTARGIMAQTAYKLGKTEKALTYAEQAFRLWDSIDEGNIGYHPATWWTHATLVVISAEKSDYQQAREKLALVFESAENNQSFHAVLMCIQRFTILLYFEGDLERAAELSAFVNTYHGTWYESRKEAKSLLNELEKVIPKTKFQEAYSRGKERTIDEIVSELSIELNINQPGQISANGF